MKRTMFGISICLGIFLSGIYLLSSHASTTKDIRYFISEEVAPCFTSGGNARGCDPYNSEDLLTLNMTHNLRNPWVSNSLSNCSEIPTRGNYIDNNRIEFITPTNEKVFAQVTLRDISQTDRGNNSFGTLATTQGVINSTSVSTMQDSSPKPITWLDLPYWNESYGSSAEGSRNAILFEFLDESNTPYEIASFGAWFGDLETRSDGTMASIITYDKNGNVLSAPSFITENSTIPLASCGTTTGLGKGCGNQTTRWIGYTENGGKNVQKLLITVGDDDLGNDGSREHLSFTGPTIIRNYGCTSTPTASLTPTTTTVLSPMPTEAITPTPVIILPTSTPVASITITPSLWPTSTITNTPLPTLTLTPSLIPTATLLPSSTPLPSPTEKPAPTKNTSPTPTQKLKDKDCCKKRPQKKLLKSLIRNLVKLLFESYQRKTIYSHFR